MSAAMKVLVNDIIVLEHMLKFIEMVPKDENDFKISEFYQPRTFAKVGKSCYLKKKFKFSGKCEREGLLPFEFPERQPS